MTKNKRSLALSLLVILTLPCGIDASNLTVPKMDDAVKSYKDRKLAQSLAQFKQIHDAGTCNELIHYYMALCYQGLNQINMARQEYTNVTKGKVPGLKAMSQNALNSLNRWGQHRSYEGNGNNFQRYSVASSKTGASGARGSNSGNITGSNGKLKEIIVDMPPPTGGGC